MRNKKKKIEYFQLKSFLNYYYPEMSNSLRCDFSQERPDFVVGDIGIEVTNYLFPERKKFDELKNKINAEISRELANKNRLGTHVSVHYPQTLCAKKNDISILGKSIAEFILENSVTDYVSFSDLEFCGFFFPHIHAMVVENSKRILVTSPDGDWVRPTDLEVLNQIIAAKEMKKINYSGCRVYWLLIVIDMVEGASFIEIGSHQENQFVQSSFEKIAIFDRYKRECLEIK